jgi:hypothetical protein
MKSKQRHLGFIVVLFLAVALVLVPGFSRPARAAGEDVAMFYDDLGQMGQWFEYENYGPVWHPSNVEEEWRPYTNGRWVPTDDGYVFESQEPWAWATYHYGNWMPTEGYGWVWVPGRTWYPSTVEWRTSPEDAPVDTSYVGWAPIPPPNYVPTQAYGAPSYYPGGAPSYYPGAPISDALTSPFWIFARAASFLLGFGQPYTPAYSYMAQPVLVSPSYVPVFFAQTVLVPTYMTPTYYPATFLGGAVAGSYAWGPPNRYISRVTNINQTVINNTIIYNSTHINRIHSVVPPQRVFDRHPHIRDITPPALVQGHRLPPSRPVTNIRQAQANLNKPNIVRLPKNVPPIRADIPRVQPVSHRPGEGIRGAGLPTKATMPLTPQQQQQIQKLPPNQQIRTAKPIKPVLTQERAIPGVTGKPGEVRPGVAGKPGIAPTGPVQPGVTGRPGEVRPGATGRPGQVQPGVKPGAIHVPEEPTPGQPSGVRVTSPQRVKGKPGVAPTGPVQPGVKPGEARPGVPLPRGQKGLSQQERQRLEQEHQRLQRGGQPAQQQQQPRELQLQQQRQREQQLQQQRQREQQQGQQQRQREQQLQQQRQREQQQGQQQRQREQQLQQQRQREQQQGQQQRQREQQLQQQQQQQRQQQLQQQRQQQQQQPQQQKQQQQKEKKKPEEQR